MPDTPDTAVPLQREARPALQRSDKAGHEGRGEEESGRNHPQAVVLDSFDDLMEVGVDGVVIATPGASHAAQTDSAPERGFTLFCQEPLDRTSPISAE